MCVVSDECFKYAISPGPIWAHWPNWARDPFGSRGPIGTGTLLGHWLTRGICSAMNSQLVKSE